jgi:uncharacterized protein DUF1206
MVRHPETSQQTRPTAGQSAGQAAGQAADEAAGAAHRAKDSRPVSWAAHAGYLGYGLLHVLIAWLAVQIAFGRSGTEGDQSGAFAVLARTGAGKVLLVAVALGLAAMTVWQALAAAVGHRLRHGRRRLLERVASGARAVVYAALAWSAGRMVVGAGRSAAANQQHATAGALGAPGGRVLVIAVGVLVAALGIGFAVFGISGRFLDNLRTGEMSAGVRRAARWTGGLGYAVKGGAYATVGVLLVTAAVRYDPNKSRGLDAALRTLAGKPYGWVPLLVIAAGFLAFALFCLGQARYRDE